MADEDRVNRLLEIINGSRIPDPIKFLPEYNGEAKTLHHWITTTGNLVALYEEVRVTSPNIFAAWIAAIRAKITGKAHEALVSRNTANEWNAIRQTLVEYFGDSRDLSTLVQKIPYLRQRAKTVADFYKETTELTSDINQKVVLDARYAGHENAVMTFVSELMKNSFIDGLNEPYNLTVRGFRPLTLEEAKSAAEEQVQSAQRNRHFASRNQNRQSYLEVQPQTSWQRNPAEQRQQFQSLPQRQNADQRQRPFVPRQNFENVAQQFPPRQNFQANAPQANAPQANADVSMRSRQIPMETSQRSRFQVANTEQEQVEEVLEESPDDLDEPFNDEINFHLVSYDETPR